MQDGFLGFRTSFMLDFVVVALIAVVPLIVLSLFWVKAWKWYRGHQVLQIVLGLVLLAAVGAFEIDLHLVQGGWRNVIAKRDPALNSEQLLMVQGFLRFHLIFAISTPFLWASTTFLALRHFSSPPQPGAHSRLHKPLGWLAIADLVMTSITGLMFYYVAFVAKY